MICFSLRTKFHVFNIILVIIKCYNTKWQVVVIKKRIKLSMLYTGDWPYMFLVLQSNKPIMEKRRRARINNCLNELKSLILDAMKKDVSIYLLRQILHHTRVYFFFISFFLLKSLLLILTILTGLSLVLIALACVDRCEIVYETSYWFNFPFFLQDLYILG